MTQALIDLGDYIAAALPGKVAEVRVAYDELMVWTTPAGLTKVLIFLKEDQNCQFKQLMDITAVDYPEREQRFEIVYNLLSLKHNHRVRVKLAVKDEAQVPSVMQVYSTAEWFEREVWDMYGVFFTDHPDLRRLLTDYGFEGHPLRKDFPLTGYVEVRYDEETKRVVYEPVKLAQEFRNFDFMSPWEGMLQPPGDEKTEAAAPGSQGEGGA